MAACQTAAIWSTRLTSHTQEDTLHSSSVFDDSILSFLDRTTGIIDYKRLLLTLVPNFQVKSVAL
eukprot:m.15040 g.15040  ORF g.15040 m.15040 type:complete len:65 (+) comp26136_c0_seq1:1291-1485(+)